MMMVMNPNSPIGTVAAPIRQDHGPTSNHQSMQQSTMAMMMEYSKKEDSNINTNADADAERREDN